MDDIEGSVYYCDIISVNKCAEYCLYTASFLFNYNLKHGVYFDDIICIEIRSIL